jgi:hypothetical protein
MRVRGGFGLLALVLAAAMLTACPLAGPQPRALIPTPVPASSTHGPPWGRFTVSFLGPPRHLGPLSPGRGQPGAVEAWRFPSRGQVVKEEVMVWRLSRRLTGPARSAYLRKLLPSGLPFTRLGYPARQELSPCSAGRSCDGYRGRLDVVAGDVVYAVRVSYVNGPTARSLLHSFRVGAKG